MTLESTTETARRYDVFISYSRKDAAFARRLEKALEAYSPPRDMPVQQRHLNVFRDETDFTGVDYYASVRAHLVNSAALLLICSPHARASKYVDDEIRQFAQAQPSRPIIPVLVSGTPNNETDGGNGTEAAFPEALCKLIAMPLAIDYRGIDPKRPRVNSSALQGQWNTLLANIYSISRDEVERREQRRQARTRNLRVATLLAIVVVLAVAFIVTLISRNDAVEQRRIAEERRVTAEAERDRAERAQQAEAVQRRLANEQEQQAIQQREVAVEQRSIATARQLAAEAAVIRSQFAARLERSTLLAVEGIRSRPLLQGDLELRRSLALLPTQVREFRHPGLVRFLTFSRDGRLLASAGGRTFGVGATDNTARVWDVQTGKALAAFKHEDYVAALAFDPTATALATASGNAGRVFQLSWPNLVHTLRHEDHVTGIAFNPDGTLVATASADRTVRLWDAATGTQVATLPHEDRVLDAVFNADGKYLVTASYDGAAIVWDVQARKPHARVACQREIYSIDLRTAPEGGELVAIGCEDWTARLFEVTTGTELASIAHTNGVYGVALAAFWMATNEGNNKIRVFDTPSGKQSAEFVHQGDVITIAASKGGRYLASASGDHTARVWDLLTRQEVTRIGQSEDVMGLAFSPDGRFIATASFGAIRVWNTVTGPGLGDMAASVLNAESGMLDESPNVSFGRDGRLLIESRPVRATRKFNQPVAANASGEHSRDDLPRTLGDGGPLKDTNVVDRHSGDFTRLTRPKGKGAAVVSPNGTFVAAADGTTVRVFERTSGTEVAQLEHSVAPERSSAPRFSFTPDSRFLVTTTNGIVYVHPLHAIDLAAEACSRLSRNLTVEEWHEYFGNEPYRRTCLALAKAPIAVPAPTGAILIDPSRVPSSAPIPPATRPEPATGPPAPVPWSATNRSITVVSNELGVFSVPLLATGVYKVRVMLTGFVTVEYEGIDVSSERGVRLFVTLPVTSSRKAEVKRATDGIDAGNASTIAGIIVDATRARIPGATIEITRLD